MRTAFFKRWTFRLKSIRFRFLFATLSLVFLFSATTVYLWYSTTYHSAEDLALTYVGEMLRVSTESCEIVLKDMNSVISSVVTNPGNVVAVFSRKASEYDSNQALLADNRKVEDYITGLYSYKQYVNGLMVAGLDGRSFTNGVVPSLDQIRAQSWYGDLLNKEGRTIFIPPHFIPSDGSLGSAPGGVEYLDQVISVGKPILNSSGTEIIGFAIADIQCGMLQETFDINMRDYGIIMVVDRNSGTYIFRSDNSSSPLLFDDNEIMRFAGTLKSEEGHVDAKLSNTDFLAIYSTSRLTGWTTIALISRSRLMSGFVATRTTNILFSILFGLFAIIATFLIMSLLTRNLMKLNRSIQRLDKDNLDISLDIRGDDEIGQLNRQFNAMVARIGALISETRRVENEKRKLEIRALQAQINPHFLYNTLSTIKFLAELNGMENIGKVSESLSMLLHTNLQEKAFISIDEEIRYLKSYLYIQNFKYSNKIVSEFIVEDGTEDLMILKLLLQPIVENAIVHGVALLKVSGVISIRTFHDGDNLMIRINDNGPGMSPQRIKEIQEEPIVTDSIGIHNVSSRIRLHFGESYGVSISSEPGIYTSVEICIPAIRSDEVDRYV